MAFDMRMMKTSTDVVDNVDAMHEIFKYLDAESLAVASCVSRQWHQAAMDDSLWERICTKNWPATGISSERFRFVVNVMGGFRRFYVKWLRPLCRHAAASCYNSNASKEDKIVRSKDQIQLCLSLLSVEHFKRLGGSSTLSKPRLCIHDSRHS